MSVEEEEGFEIEPLSKSTIYNVFVGGSSYDNNHTMMQGRKKNLSKHISSLNRVLNIYIYIYIYLK
jgi:hypothetical protein